MLCFQLFAHSVLLLIELRALYCKLDCSLLRQKAVTSCSSLRQGCAVQNKDSVGFQCVQYKFSTVQCCYTTEECAVYEAEGGDWGRTDGHCVSGGRTPLTVYRLALILYSVPLYCMLPSLCKYPPCTIYVVHCTLYLL